MIVFISGGARSGKSQFAEDKALALFEKQKQTNETAYLYYVATAKRTDTEMVERIGIHQQSRSNKWSTIEEPFHVLNVLKTCRTGGVILLDCLTIWLSNAMFDHHKSKEELITIINSWIDTAKLRNIQLIIVSNDVNEGFPVTDKYVSNYMYLLQKLHQLIVNRAEHVIQLQAGIPTVWKGGGL
ncbi:bifunctional adenosylcobinamide kinase/adenosylcobinamide-phosphate guanylyltransferase [Metabacillus malikii]|uniref:Adenosylcobinamide kinase n=1 Tax=Metabacillus malikii TaxID=1504265 RepID=A0ABT9ZAM3_9BACI|nr:bifunctional adenosylcobinamide kinase/adenosylcobinamide-phosphate guanylyltransferase [Metabacillus malikii]MDQ0228994.1 adenosylcobinamide kinase/adenosylcobinamide-phosphate guanylyltransferase [Metabacillus malikii]